MITYTMSADIIKFALFVCFNLKWTVLFLLVASTPLSNATRSKERKPRKDLSAATRRQSQTESYNTEAVTRLQNNYSQTHADCSVTLISHFGNISSPNYPGKYPLGSFCDWIIYASAGYTITLTFITFDLPKAMESHCRSGFVEYGDFDENNKRKFGVGHLCGQIPYLSYTSGGHVCWITFYGGLQRAENSTHSGIMVLFKAVKEEKRYEATLVALFAILVPFVCAIPLYFIIKRKRSENPEKNYVRKIERFRKRQIQQTLQKRLPRKESITISVSNVKIEISKASEDSEDSTSEIIPTKKRKVDADEIEAVDLARSRHLSTSSVFEDTASSMNAPAYQDSKLLTIPDNIACTKISKPALTCSSYRNSYNDHDGTFLQPPFPSVTSFPGVFPHDDVIEIADSNNNDTGQRLFYNSIKLHSPPIQINKCCGKAQDNPFSILKPSNKIFAHHGGLHVQTGKRSKSAWNGLVNDNTSGIGNSLVSYSCHDGIKAAAAIAVAVPSIFSISQDYGLNMKNTLKKSESSFGN